MPRPRWLLPFPMLSWRGCGAETMGFSGKSKIKKGNSKCLLASVRQKYQSKYWSYNYHWGEWGMSQCIHGFYRTGGRSHRSRAVLWPVRNPSDGILCQDVLTDMGCGKYIDIFQTSKWLVELSNMSLFSLRRMVLPKRLPQRLGSWIWVYWKRLLVPRLRWL